ncbi:hypothetical protein mRhiFer1_009317 [Rhinolophus ferrumequinum]|uniref:Uncharacterized protein n=1 Tax=Rhinolophus ferrumequinum TaxID=59479 RepID=A0A7J7RXR9_RHIFE|nr:hypothetical protein mRhiFer1_009317 [Rhinolophus ferrumequinum]
MLVRMESHGTHTWPVGMQKDAATMENSLVVSYKVQHNTVQHDSPTPRYLLKKNENLCSTAYINFILGKNKPPRNNSNVRHLGMGRQTPVHVVAAQSATWASPGRYAGGMKPDTKTAYWDSISSPFCKRQNYRGRVLPGLRVGGRFHYVGAAQGTLWGVLMELFCILIVVVGYTTP